jgi:hypothetical protein
MLGDIRAKINRIGEAVVGGQQIVASTPQQVSGAEAVGALAPVTAMLDQTRGQALDIAEHVQAAKTIALRTLDGSDPQPMLGALELIITALAQTDQRRTAAQQAIQEFINDTSTVGRAGN